MKGWEYTRDKSQDSLTSQLWAELNGQTEGHHAVHHLANAQRSVKMEGTWLVGPRVLRGGDDGVPF